jgi:RNA polymerase sigma-70 factor (ECF subfamily)
MGVELIDRVTEPSDADLLKAHRGGDAASFDAFYRRYRDRLFLYARSRTRDDGAAEDLVNETFLRAAQSAAGSGSLASFLFTVLRRLSIDRARSEEALRRREQSLRTQWVEAAAPGVDPDALEELNQALRTLPSEQLEAVVLHVYGDLTFAEAAEVVGVPPKTMMSRYAYALDRLAGIMKGPP